MAEQLGKAGSTFSHAWLQRSVLTPSLERAHGLQVGIDRIVSQLAGLLCGPREHSYVLIDVGLRGHIQC